jgi:hypothetical protein
MHDPGCAGHSQDKHIETAGSVPALDMGVCGCKNRDALDHALFEVCMRGQGSNRTVVPAKAW